MPRIERPDDLRPRLGGGGGYRASLYVPLDRASARGEASELRLRAALERVEERLRERGLPPSEAPGWRDRLLEAAPELRHPEPAARTLVLLADARGAARATVTEELPERVAVAPHYALRPLLRAFQREGHFRVLAVSANRVSAFRGDARGLRRVEVPGLPGSLEDALGDRIEGSDVSFRSGQPGLGPRAGGVGGADTGREIDRERFHRALARAIGQAWAANDEPVLIAAEVRTAGELRKALSLPGLLEEELRGNPDQATPEALHAAAVPLVRAALERRERELATAFERACNAGKALDGVLDDAVEAAFAGRVRRLWVEADARIPGQLDAVRARPADPEGPDDDVLDGLVEIVVQRGGEVHVVGEGETPTRGPWCLQLR